MSQDIETATLESENFVIASTNPRTTETLTTGIIGYVLFHYSREQIGIISAGAFSKSIIVIPEEVCKDEDWLFVRPLAGVAASNGKFGKVQINWRDVLSPLSEEGVDNFVGKKMKIVRDDGYFIVLDRE